MRAGSEEQQKRPEFIISGGDTLEHSFTSLHELMSHDLTLELVTLLVSIQDSE